MYCAELNLIVTLQTPEAMMRPCVCECVDGCSRSCGRLGGPDPLDYISMYRHDGQTEDGVPPHWHYVG